MCFSDSAWLPGFAAKLQTTACLPDLRTGRQIETTTEHKSKIPFGNQTWQWTILDLGLSENRVYSQLKPFNRDNDH